MKRKHPASFPSTKRQVKRRYLTMKEIEKRVALLLLLLQHNFETVMKRKRAR
jgi:hypothetical protein